MRTLICGVLLLVVGLVVLYGFSDAIWPVASAGRPGSMPIFTGMVVMSGMGTLLSAIFVLAGVFMRRHRG